MSHNHRKRNRVKIGQELTEIQLNLTPPRVDLQEITLTHLTPNFNTNSGVKLTPISNTLHSQHINTEKSTLQTLLCSSVLPTVVCSHTVLLFYYS